MSPGTPNLTIHAGEGHSAAGVNEAMQQAKETPVGGVVETAVATISEVASKGTMGLDGIWRTIGNASAMLIICGMVLYGMVFTIPETQTKFHQEIEAERSWHERQQKLDRDMYDAHRVMVEDRADARLEKFGSSLRTDIRDAIREAVRAKELPE